MASMLKSAQKISRKGSYDKALELYDLGLSKQSGDFGLILHKAILLNKIGRSSEAIELLHTQQEEGVLQGLLRCFEALFEYDLGNMKKARTLLLKELLVRPDSRLAQAFLLLIHLQAEDYESAGHIIVEAGLSDSPYFKIRFYSLIESYFIKHPERPQADAIAAVEQEATQDNNKTKHAVLVQTGTDAYFDAEYLKALKHFLLACRQKPEDVDSLLGLAEVYSSIGYFEKAGEYHDTLAKIVGNDEANETSTKSRKMLRWLTGWWQRRQEEDVSWPKHYQAKHWVRTGRAQDAVAVFEDLFRQNSNHVESHLEIAIAHLVMGQETEARAALARNLDVDSDTYSMQVQTFLKATCHLDAGFSLPFAKRMRRAMSMWMTGRYGYEDISPS